jgi:hypothetical protein
MEIAVGCETEESTRPNLRHPVSKSNSIMNAAKCAFFEFKQPPPFLSEQRNHGFRRCVLLL